MAHTPARRDDERLGLGTAIVGGVIAAFVLFWLVGIVIGTFLFFARIAVIGAVIGLGIWAWSRFSRD